MERRVPSASSLARSDRSGPRCRMAMLPSLPLPPRRPLLHEFPNSLQPNSGDVHAIGGGLAGLKPFRYAMRQ